MVKGKNTDRDNRKSPVLQTLEPSKKWEFGRRIIVSALIISYVWGSLLIFAVLMGRDSAVIGVMFEADIFMIFSLNGILVGGKAFKTFGAMKWSGKNDSNSA